MEDKLQEIKRKLNNEILENESDTYLQLDEYLTTDDIQWLIKQTDKIEKIRDLISGKWEDESVYAGEIQDIIG